METNSTDSGSQVPWPRLRRLLHDRFDALARGLIAGGPDSPGILTPAVWLEIIRRSGDHLGMIRRGGDCREKIRWGGDYLEIAEAPSVFQVLI